jgi:hypothetical protein
MVSTKINYDNLLDAKKNILTIKYDVINSFIPNLNLYRNVSSDDVKEWLIIDKTDELIYIDHYFVCSNFASIAKDNASKVGLHFAYVEIKGVENDVWQGHAVNAINTTDKGLIFIEPQTDKIIDVEIGNEYNDFIIKTILIVW